MTKILQGKNAIIYGAGGSLGGAVAKALAEAGATIFLTGRNLPSLEQTALEIQKLGGVAYADKVDAFNENEINDHLLRTKEKARTIDISFNAVATNVVQNIPLVELSPDDFMQPVSGMLHTRFLTAKAAAKHMIVQKFGVILTLTATPGGIGYPYTAGFAPACAAIETFSQNLASELGIYGIRVVNMRSGGSPDSRVFKNAVDNDPIAMSPVLKQMEDDTMLKRLPSMADIANLAVFLSSDLARSITGVTVDVSSGTTAGLNYRVK